VGVRWIATLLVILGVWATLPTVEADGATGPADRLDFAPIASSVLTRPVPVKGTDGRFHIVYEVLLTNNTPVPMSVEGFEVRDARTRRVLARLSGPSLAANMGPVAGPPAPSTNDPPRPETGGRSVRGRWVGCGHVDGVLADVSRVAGRQGEVGPPAAPGAPHRRLEPAASRYAVQLQRARRTRPDGRRPG
jgi:hypothetical protein